MSKKDLNEYKPRTKKMERYQWEDEIIRANILGYLSNSQVLTLLKLASAMNWYTYKGELRWSNQKACEESGVSEATLYRNIKKILKTGFLIKDGRNYRAKYPNEFEVIRYNQEKSQKKKNTSQDKNEYDPWSTPISQVEFSTSQDESSTSQFEKKISQLD